MAREWASIDVLRMDKFMLLVRRYLAASFRYLHSNDWKEEELQKHSSIMEKGPLQYVLQSV